MIFIWTENPKKGNRKIDAPFAVTFGPGRKSTAALQIRWFPLRSGCDRAQAQQADIQTLNRAKIGIQKSFRLQFISMHDYNILHYPGRFSLPFFFQTR